MLHIDDISDGDIIEDQDWSLRAHKQPNKRQPPKNTKYSDQNMVMVDVRSLSSKTGSLKEKANREIVCVDDNFINLNSFQIMLGMMGYPGKV